MLYFPLLRTKKGEIEALLALRPASVSHLHPVLQVPPPDLDDDGNPVAPSAVYVDRLFSTLRPLLGMGSPLACFLDSVPGELPIALLERLLAAVRSQNGLVRPVIYLTGSEDCLRLHEHYFGPLDSVVLRVPAAYFTPRLPTAVTATLAHYGLRPDQVLVLLDAGNLSDKAAPINLYELAMTAAVLQLQRLGVAGIIIGAAAIPPKDENLKKWVPMQYLRRELALFSEVKAATGYDLHFADYATGNVIDTPSPSFQGAPKVRYTLPDGYEVLKGEKAGTGRGGMTMGQQYERLSTHIVNHPDYQGPHFSWGDGYIHASSQPEATNRGNATTWVKVATSHHLELVVSMLPAM